MAAKQNALILELYNLNPFLIPPSKYYYNFKLNNNDNLNQTV